ncbi:MAG TPA: FtsK/SpoIIIE domain-containing protein [Actinomycetota bacterium]|nr:FtsK/SpoIIIE domain-containing protein [Actinomycetota bacterium]
MQLFLRVRPTGGEARDLRIEVDPQATVAALASELARALGDPSAVLGPPGRAPGLFREVGGVRIDPYATVAASGLVSGALVVVGPPPPREAGRHPEAGGEAAAAVLEVLGGPDAGRRVDLTPGHHPVGADPGPGLALRDPSLAPRQFLLDVHPDGHCFVRPDVAAPGSVTLDGQPLRAVAEVPPGTVLRAGATSLAIRRGGGPGPLPGPEAGWGAGSAVGSVAGTVAFHRTPYRPAAATDRALPALDDIPTRPDPRRFSLLAGLAPLAGGLILYAFVREPQFLALTALTPITMGATWWDERRSGGRRFDREAARFRNEVTARRREVAAALDAERAERLQAAPDLAELAGRAERRSVDLWARGRGSADFLALRLGLGEVASRVRAPVGTQGDGDLRREAAGILDGHGSLQGVPIVLALRELGAVALLGPPPLVHGLAASLVLQAAVLHSPEDLIVFAALAPGNPLADQVKWLPHTRSLSSPLATEHVVASARAGQELCSRLVAIAQQRAAGRDRDTDRRWPWLTVLLDEALGLNPSVVAQLLEWAPAAGMSVLWLTADPGRVPQRCEAVARCVPSAEGHSELWFRDSGRAVVAFAIETLDREPADRAMRALAPVRDASSATVTSAIPRVVPLFDALGFDETLLEPERLGRAVVERWVAERGYALEAPVGMAADGPLTIDLVADGPHALIGGTSGSGKSELLVALVSGLVSRHSPDRLNLLFVDYKGGAASSVFRDAPHTVGYVTNLNGDLANRALVSLRAELNRRMHLMAGRAKDLGEMLATDPDTAPPSLVIVVDEFATLVKEVPEFVPGIVDIAQRGRSLGIHLILATQRPSGAVNENILANTNARISLRMIDGAESSSIIGTPDAAAIPVPLRGRAFARLGPGELIAFQSAYGGAPLDRGASRIEIADFSAGGVRGPGLALGSRAEAPPGKTQLEALLGAVKAAEETLHIRTPRAPWLDELPPVVPLETVMRGYRSRPGRWSIPVGEYDDPQSQRQDTVALDLEESGGLAIYGGGGSGKTTALRTVAAAAVLAAPPEGVALLAIDFASRALRALEGLEACAGVATADDLEAVTRTLAVVEQEIARRRALLAGAETLSAYLAAGGPPMPRVLLLIDGYPTLRDVLTGEGASAAMHGWLERLHRLVAEGRQVGVHTVITADRPNGVAPVLASAIGRRLILRQVDERSLIELGVPAARARGVELGPGRGFLDDLTVQVACVTTEGGPTDGGAQAARLAKTSARARPASVPPWLRSSPLRDVEALPPVAAGTGPLVAALGVEDVSRAPVLVDLAEGSLIIAGPPKSGRSSALAALLAGLRSPDVLVAGLASSPLARQAVRWRAAFGDPTALAVAAGELAQLATSYPDIIRVLVLDDADRLLEDPAAWAALDPLARCDAVRVVAAVETASLLSGYFQSLLMQQVKKVRRRFLLQPMDAGELQSVLGMRMALRPGLTMPAGRGVLLAGRSPLVLQVGTPGVGGAGS